MMRPFGERPFAAAGILLILIFVICATFASSLAPHDPTQLNLTNRLLGPSSLHWFGTDELGRDILSRILFGARTSMVVAVSVVSLSGVVGLLFGCVAGF